MVIGSLQQTDTQEEKCAISTMIHALEEYKRLLNLEDWRRNYFALFEDKEKIGKIRIKLRDRRKNESITPCPIQ